MSFKYDFESYEDLALEQPMLYLNYSFDEDDALSVLLKAVDYLDNELLGKFMLINNRILYVIDIHLKEANSYEFRGNQRKPYQLEVQRMDTIRFKIEPLVNVINRIFAFFPSELSYQFYNIYIKHIKDGNYGYTKRSVNKRVRQILATL